MQRCLLKLKGILNSPQSFFCLLEREGVGQGKAGREVQVSLHCEAGFCACLENPLKTNKSKRHARVKRMDSDSDSKFDCDCDCDSPFVPLCLPLALLCTGFLIPLRQASRSQSQSRVRVERQPKLFRRCWL